MQTRASKHLVSPTPREQRLFKRQRVEPEEDEEEPVEHHDVIPEYLKSIREEVGCWSGLPEPLVGLIVMYHLYSLKGELERQITVRKHAAVLFIKSLDRKRVVCSNCEALRVLNVQSGEFEVVARKSLQGDITLLRGGELGVISENEFVIFHATGQVRTTLPDVWTWFCNFVLLPDNRIMGAQAHTVRVWNLDNGECLQVLEQPEIVLSMALLPSGKMVAGTRDNAARVWDLATGTCEATLLHSDEVTCLIPTPAGLVSAAGDGSLRLWDLTSFACLHLLQPSGAWVSGMVVLPGNRLATSSQAGVIQIFDLSTGAVDLTLQGMGPNCSPVARLYLLLDGRLLSTSEDTTLRVWDVHTGSCELVLSSNSTVISVAQVADGRMVCGTRDGRILVWI